MEVELGSLNVENISVSTHTYIAYTNLEDLDLESIFNEVKICDPLIHALYKKREKGFKKKKNSKNISKNFLNCISFTFNKNNKKVNLKVFRNGVVQLTGCKSFEHCKFGIVIFWDLIKTINCIENFNSLELFLVSVMRNVNFNLGFFVDREKLGKYIVERPATYKISPVIGGFIGMKFVIELESIDDMPVYKFKMNDKGLIEEEPILYKNFVNIIKLNNKNTKKNINIAIFQTGRVLISGIHEKYQIPIIEWFLKLIREVKNDIKTKDKKIFVLEKYLKPSNFD